MDQVMQFVEPSRQFVKDSIRLVKRCTKPDRKEFQKIAMATAIGFAIMGFIGFFVKLIHIPINNIIVENVGTLGLQIEQTHAMKHFRDSAILIPGTHQITIRQQIKQKLYKFCWHLLVIWILAAHLVV
ncbi:protein transport protein Sec61 subunit gamma isoform X1 [Python bivittatus]|uniref:Protein transport protein Sec61 subunit gamma n=1 Tax=Python bivittatus TaxID=176946 RepID=A0A9F5N5H8_PYTBI|nr:protein transport protein Sec61 subunit gamma isoform X1 [Python bivittatus]